MRADDGAETPIVLAEDGWFSNANITAFRYGAIGGSVVDETGEPIVDLTVRAFSRLSIAGNPRFASSQSARTDDRGIYRISGLPPGSYAIGVPRNGTGVARDEVYPPTLYPGSLTAAGARPLTLAAGQELSDIDFAVRPVPGRSVSGRVEGPTDALINLALQLVQAGDSAIETEAVTALVDEGGRFFFSGVPDGSYEIRATPSRTEVSTGIFSSLTAGAMAQLVPALPTEASGSPPEGFGFRSSGGTNALSYVVFGDAQQRRMRAHWARHRVDVTGRDVEGVVLTLMRAISLQGSVVNEQGQVSTQRAPLLAFPASGDPALNILPSDINTPGSFLINGLMPGRYHLRTSGPAVVRAITWNGKDFTDAPFDAAAGLDFSEITVTLATTPPLIVGSIRDRNGEPVSNARILYIPADRTLWSNLGWFPVRAGSVSATSAGSYSLASARIPAGDYYLLAVRSARARFWEDAALLNAVANAGTRVSVAWSETYQVTLTLSNLE